MPPRRIVTGRSQEPRKRFMEELRRMREEKQLSLRKLGEALGWDHSLFGKMETGGSMGSPEVVQALDQFYGTTPMLLTLWELAMGDPTQFRERYRRYMLLEAEAVNLWHFGISTVHGLLQTERYARAILAADGIDGLELEQEVEARVGRRMLLDSGCPPHFRTILSEAVLRSPLPNTEAWQEQLERLLTMSERTKITLQVLPLAVGPHGLDSTDVMFLNDPDGNTVAYTENALRGDLIEQPTPVRQLQLRYDAVRDLALSPAESRNLITQMLEEVSCDPST
ncbi:helix-turn-helix domain-containing protein [Streptomyces paludis]|uniref:XRE family transcriptional regulator n=1 Tax=Streptomyces paludis TaxID=2282738 RepID=A0A345HRT6_9ACTN|nr:helix-turn-helix transcriptional regulator [Streptomyces paludis]AXG79410.1 XRE family transcriptional regulator [Streptomyces paludis]